MIESKRHPAEAPPRLALAMIVRDGGQFLDSLLSAAGAEVDEIVIVDTGSRDASLETAERHGARIVTFPWCDDFAAARNVSLAACRAEWVLCLDADEQLAPADWRLVRRTVDEWSIDRPLAGNVLTRNYVAEPWSRRDWEPVPDSDPHALPGRSDPVAAGFVPTRKVRLFPRHPRVQFRGRLHETVEDSLVETGVPVIELPVVVHHFGMLSHNPAKLAGYLALAGRKAAEQPDDVRAWRELCDCAVATGDLPQALGAITRALALVPEDAGARLTAGWLLKEQGRFAQAEVHLLAVARAPGATDREVGQACHLRAQVAMLDGRAESAGPLLAAALRMAPGDGHIHNTLGVWHLTGARGDAARLALERAAVLLPHLPDPCLNLARLYEAAGRPELAARHYEQALQRDPANATATGNLALLAARA